jgi:nucleotide-binding universal stress UspA family protein
MAKPLHEPGVTIDGFRLEEMLHRGGMATLWRVSHPSIGIPMLMKVPRIGELADPAAIVSFEMELLIMPRLTGPHVPKFIAAGDFDSQPYIVMEHIDGQTLLSKLPELPLSYAQAAEAGAKIAMALNDVHRQHVVHLDIKPSNIIVRPTGEVVLLDYGLAHHDQLPDLMQEEYRVPFGTAPYISPEQLRGIRNDARSDLFALGVLLYFFSTEVRPFGEGERLSTMRRRLWRDPYPPRQLRPDCPPAWQEIVLRCLEIESAWRYPTAAQLAFDLSHLDQVKLTARAERLQRDPFTTVLRRRFNKDLTRPPAKATIKTHLASAPIVAVAIDLGEPAGELNDALRTAAAQILTTLPSARLACLNVLKEARIWIESTLDAQGQNKHIDRMVGLKHWAEPLKLDDSRLTVHVIEAVDPAAAILDFVRGNRIDHVLIGARQSSILRTLLGSVSAKVAAEAPCTVTIVRPGRVDNSAARQNVADPSI